MDCLEDITTRMHDGYYVDLFVRASNKTAIQMYTKVRNVCAYGSWCCAWHAPTSATALSPGVRAI